MFRRTSNRGIFRDQQSLQGDMPSQILLLLPCLLVMQLFFMPPHLVHGAPPAQNSSLVTQEIRYQMPEAGEVFLVWGINGWAVVPQETHPAKTVVKDGLMWTPMERESDTFLLKVQVPAGATIDYAFQISKARSGETIEVWDTNGEPKKDYHTLAVQEGMSEVQATQAMRRLVQMQTSANIADDLLVTQQIHYHISEASEVFIVWGIDGWNTVPEAMRPAGTVVKDGVMFTPMAPQDDSFFAAVDVPARATIDYAFQITKARNGDRIEIWDANGSSNKDDHTVALQGNVLEIQASPFVVEQIAADDLDIELPPLALILTPVAILLALLATGRAWIRGQTLLLIIVLVVAANLRLNHLRQPLIDAFSWRQTSTAMMAQNYYLTNWNIFYPEVNWTGPGPNYQGREFQTVTYIAALLYAVLGQQDWIGRTVSVLFGLWGIFALYQLVRRVWDEERAIASAAMMALLPGSIFIERSFLPDPAMVALVTTSFWMLVVYLQTDRRRYLLLASVIGVWGLLTKIPGLIVGLPMTYTTFTILGRKRMLIPKKLVTLGLVAILTLIPVIAYYLWARHLAISYPPHHFAGSGNWLWDAGLKQWISQDYFLPRLSQRFVWMWTIPVTALVLLGLFFPLPREEGKAFRSLPLNGQAPWLFHWWLLAVVIYYLIGAQELVENPWNFHIINPAAAALAGHALVSLISFRSQLVWSPVSLVTIIALLFMIAGFGQAALAQLYEPYAKESYEMGLALSQMTEPGDLVVTMANDLGDPIAIYYSQRRGWIFPPAESGEFWGQLPEDDQQAIQLFEELRAKGARWLGIVEEQRYNLWKHHPALAEHIEQSCQLHSQTKQYMIFRILTPDEARSLPSEAALSSRHD